MIRTVAVPLFMVSRGVGKNHRGVERGWNVAGVDAETVQYSKTRLEPYSLQFSEAGCPPVFVRVNTATVMDRFMEWLDRWAKPRVLNVVYFHNLPFDLQAVLYGRQHLFLSGKKVFDVHHPLGVLTCRTDKAWWATATLSGGRRVRIGDTMQYLEDSLAGSAASCGLDVGKLAKPAYLGTREPNARERPGFMRYAKRDAEVARKLGEEIRDFHRHWDIKWRCSMASAAWTIFRHRFLRKEDVIRFPPMRVAVPSDCAAHGGKVRMYAKPGIYRGVYDLDMNQAYCEGLRQLPSPLGGRWVYVKEWPRGAHGVLKVSGSLRDEYGIIFSHDFNDVRGDFADVWTTTYEVDEAMRSRSLNLTSCEGWIWVEQHGARNPFREFADAMYRMRTEAPEHSFMRHAAKQLPNKLWGKLGQVHRSIKSYELDDDARVKVKGENVAAPSYNPFWWALPSGYVRARIHAYEMKYGSLHTATDGFMTQTKPEPEDIGPALGQLKIKEFGTLTLLEPLRYIHGRHTIHKGLRVSEDDLRRAAPSLLKGRTVSIASQKIYGVREAHRQRARGILPLAMIHHPVSYQLAER